MNKKVAIIGYGYVGKAYHKMFPDAVIYDEPQRILSGAPKAHFIEDSKFHDSDWGLENARKVVNQCDMAIVAVPTDLDGNELNMSIIESVVGWLETPLILIKSALQPGTVDRLFKKTGKDIAVSVEFIGEGTYNIPFWKYPHVNDPNLHQLLIVGGETKTAEACAEILWSRMSPDVRIHLVTAVEAEITKMAENTYGALKVTWANVLRDICDKYDASFIRVHQAWSEDGRVDPMHTRSVSYNRGWKSKCYSKDVAAFANLVDSKLLKGMLADNERHLKMNG